MCCFADAGHAFLGGSVLAMELLRRQYLVVVSCALGEPCVRWGSHGRSGGERCRLQDHQVGLFSGLSPFQRLGRGSNPKRAQSAGDATLRRVGCEDAGPHTRMHCCRPEPLRASCDPGPRPGGTRTRLVSGPEVTPFAGGNGGPRRGRHGRRGSWTPGPRSRPQQGRPAAPTR
jgi:hypothetical protein